MHADADSIQALAEQVRQGDAAAAAQLQRHLEPRLVVVVGRALAADSTALPLTRWIRAQAQQLRPAAGRRPGEVQAYLIVLLARRLGEWLIEGLRAGSCNTRMLQDTVCT